MSKWDIPFSILQTGTKTHPILLPTFGNPNFLPLWLLPCEPFGCSIPRLDGGEGTVTL